MTTGNPVKLILVFAFPILAGNMLQQLYKIVEFEASHHLTRDDMIEFIESGASEWLGNMMII